MERKEIERIKQKVQSALEQGRFFFGKEAYDNHVIDVLEHFGYSIDDKEIIEIFGKLERK